MTSSNIVNESYIVLARKYRPTNFIDLKGQEVLVETISNAIKLNRIPHAFLLTGIRGIGKTTTARIIAKTLSCTDRQIVNDIVVPCNQCSNCEAMNHGKHPDIIEIDAASKTGVSDIREVIENCRYLPQLSKYKLYVIDEVHMLSINAFNALLKTLEEPPQHVIFVLATTEVRKVPVTILSRTQRFDLKRLSHDAIVEHLEYILSKENFTAEKEALDLIAKCSEGSVRDSLSLLDQALMYNKEKLTLDHVSSILGVSDKSEVIRLFTNITKGDAAGCLNIVNDLYFNGYDLILLFNELLSVINLISQKKFLSELSSSNAIYSKNDAQLLENFSKELSVPYLTVIWQIIINGINEIQHSINILGSAQMLLIKCCYISDKPMPTDLIEKIETEDILEKKNSSIDTKQSYVEQPIVEKNIKSVDDNKIQEIELDHHQVDTNSDVNIEDKADINDKIKINSFKELVNLFYNNKEMILYHHLYEDVHLVKFEPRILKIRTKENVPHNFANQIANFLYNWTSNKWVVTISSEQGDKTLQEADNQILLEKNNEIVKHDLVQEVLNQFEGSKITNIISKE